jgi:hypothetical protein
MVFATFNDLEIRYYAHLFNFHTYKRGALHIKCTPTIDIEPKIQKQVEKNESFFSTCFIIRDLSDSPMIILNREFFGRLFPQHESFFQCLHRYERLIGTILQIGMEEEKSLLLPCIDSRLQTCLSQMISLFRN